VISGIWLGLAAQRTRFAGGGGAKQMRERRGVEATIAPRPVPLRVKLGHGGHGCAAQPTGPAQERAHDPMDHRDEANDLRLVAQGHCAFCETERMHLPSSSHSQHFLPLPVVLPPVVLPPVVPPVVLLPVVLPPVVLPPTVLPPGVLPLAENVPSQVSLLSSSSNHLWIP
jgi:hypothetical protein